MAGESDGNHNHPLRWVALLLIEYAIQQAVGGLTAAAIAAPLLIISFSDHALVSNTLARLKISLSAALLLTATLAFVVLVADGYSNWQKSPLRAAVTAVTYPDIFAPVNTWVRPAPSYRPTTVADATTEMTSRPEPKTPGHFEPKAPPPLGPARAPWT